MGGRSRHRAGLVVFLGAIVALVAAALQQDWIEVGMVAVIAGAGLMMWIGRSSLS